MRGGQLLELGDAGVLRRHGVGQRALALRLGEALLVLALARRRIQASLQLRNARLLDRGVALRLAQRLGHG